MTPPSHRTKEHELQRYKRDLLRIVVPVLPAMHLVGNPRQWFRINDIVCEVCWMGDDDIKIVSHGGAETSTAMGFREWLDLWDTGSIKPLGGDHGSDDPLSITESV